MTITSKDRLGNVSVDAELLHVREAEKTIGERVERSSGAASVRVTCPDIVAGKKGESFDCAVSSADGDATLVVTMTDDQGSFTYQPKQ